jgi:hypothetical protein
MPPAERVHASRNGRRAHHQVREHQRWRRSARSSEEALAAAEAVFRSWKGPGAEQPDQFFIRDEKTGRHAFNPKALKALGVDPAAARERGYPLKESEETESNLAA